MVARAGLLLAKGESASDMRHDGVSSILREKGDHTEKCIDRLALKPKLIQADKHKKKDVQETLFPDLSKIL